MKPFATTFVAVALAAITTFAPALFAGAVGGPKAAHHIVNAYDTDIFNIWFEGGEPAEVVVIGDGDTDLDLEVVDKYGDVIASDTDPTDDCIVRFWPNRTATYTVRVKNLGSVYNRYYIETN